MKKLLIICALCIPTSLLANENLATYYLTTGISGMAAEGLPPGAGDRALTYELKFPATSGDTANALFYKHLDLLLGDNQVKRFEALAEDIARQLGR